MAEAPGQPSEMGGSWWREARYRVKYAVLTRICRTIGHQTADLWNIGIGFGAMDFFCGRCGALLAQKPIDSLTDDERAAVGDVGAAQLLFSEPASVTAPPAAIPVLSPEEN